MVGGNPTKPSCSFYPCLHPAACLGKANDVYEGRYLESRDFFNERELAINETSSDDKAVVDLALYQHWDEACDEDRGYANNCTNSDNQPSRCRLCGTCKPGYKRYGGGTKCKQCPPPSANRALLILGFLCCAALLCLLIYTAVRAETTGRGRSRSALKKILLNFFAMVSLAGGLPLNWPPILETIFEWFEIVSSAGSNLLIPDCELSELKTVDVFYMKQIFYTCIPPLVAVVCLGAWLGVWKCGGVCRRCSAEGTEIAATTTTSELFTNMAWSRVKDAIILSIVLILFLCYPLLTKLALSVLKCPFVGGNFYLLADLQEVCFVGRHLSYFLALTVPQILGYVIGMPLVATWLIVRSGSRRLQESASLHMRYSLLFAGYVEGREWWEAIIVLRKVSMVLLGTYGSMLQSVEKTSSLALVIVFLSIIAHLLGKPFGTESGRAWRLHLLELMALFVVWFINWAGQMLYLGTSPMVQIILTFLIVLSITCYLVGALYAYLYEVRVKRREKKRRTLIAQGSEAPPQQSTVAVLPLSSSSLHEDHETEVNTLMEMCDSHAEAQNAKLAQRRKRSHRKTMDRLAQRRRLKESRRMRSVKVFMDLDDASLAAIVDTMTPKAFSPGHVIVRQGDPAESFYILLSGRVEVRRKTLVDSEHGQVIGHLSTFDHFGEGALITATRRHFLRTSGMSGEAKVQTRNATVIAGKEGDVQTMMMTDEDLEKMLREDKIDVKTLMRVCREEHERREAHTSLPVYTSTG